jgi:ribonucleotide monophosphatase NagD (HAD superfamily)
MTYFVDIDGVVFKHKNAGALNQWFDMGEPIMGTIATLSRLEAEGVIIVLVTARPNWMRQVLQQALYRHHVVHHHLLMGVTSGLRYIVNDRKADGSLSCIAINPPRNQGF